MSPITPLDQPDRRGVIDSRLAGVNLGPAREVKCVTVERDESTICIVRKTHLLRAGSVLGTYRKH